jgi:hypothetical protein
MRKTPAVHPGPASQDHGQQRIAAAVASTVVAIGRVTNTIHDPSPAASARLRCCSDIGPRIAPITAGASGICPPRVE